MSLKIYFGGSIKGGREDAPLYAQIIENLRSYGTVLTEHVGSDVGCNADKELTAKFIHDRDIEWLNEADVMVAEVTVTSLGVGYELGRAVALGKPVLCLFRPNATDKALSCMIDGAHNDSSFIVKRYSGEEYKEILKEYFASFKKSS